MLGVVAVVGAICAGPAPPAAPPLPRMPPKAANNIVDPVEKEQVPGVVPDPPAATVLDVARSPPTPPPGMFKP